MLDGKEKDDLDVVDESGTSEGEIENQNQETKIYSEQEMEQRLEQQRNQINEDNQKAWNKRWGREKDKIEKENLKKDELINLLKNQTKTESIDDLLKNAYEQYDIERPMNQRTKKDEEILGKNDAKSILDLEDEGLIEEEAERLSKIERNVREEATFLELGKYLKTKKEEEKRKKEIQEAGIDESIFEKEDFKSLLNKMDKSTSIKDVYEIYSKINTPVKKEKPFTPGSLKGSKEQGDGIKDFYTFEESKNFTRKDFDENPKLFERVKASMPLWSKNK